MQHKQSSSRRKFIANSVKGGLAVSIGVSAAGPVLASVNVTKTHNSIFFQTGFDQQPLPYDYNALEYVIDARTMEIHYSKHAAAYAKNVTEAAQAEGVDMNKPLEEVLWKISKYSAKMRNNGGGHYNHELFWKCMRPKLKDLPTGLADNRPSDKLLHAIESAFTSFTEFKNKFGEAGKNRFGSGWSWLYIDDKKMLRIGSTPNQDNPLMDISEIKGNPLLALDVWEHAYYLKYQNKRTDYIENWWNIVNWDYVQMRFDKLS